MYTTASIADELLAIANARVVLNLYIRLHTLQCTLEMLKPLNFSARPIVHFSAPARPVIKFFYFRPVWACENILSSMFYNKTTNYLVLTDLPRRRLNFDSRKEHTAKYYWTETLINFIYKLAYTIFKKI